MAAAIKHGRLNAHIQAEDRKGPPYVEKVAKGIKVTGNSWPSLNPERSPRGRPS
jgi:hypothetical protein